MFAIPVHLRSLALLAALLPFAACATDPESEKALPAEGQTVNTICPLLEESVDPAYQTVWQGQRVGFCCKDCLADWAGMSDAERQAALDSVRR